MILTRSELGPNWAIGELVSPDHGDGVVIWQTLERTYLYDWASKVPREGWAPKIPPGTYECVRGEHQLEHGPSFETFEVRGVEGHSGLLFHNGNLESDSRGCILLGEVHGAIDGKTAVLESGVEFDRFMAFLQGVNSFSLEVVNAVQHRTAGQGGVLESRPSSSQDSGHAPAADPVPDVTEHG